ncbi:hydrogenase 4 subunit D [Serratia fonticola]|uniref:Hydrogenase 4 subunit D n=1 Tax=Serratia fonticola TaxID=47917 RepID=A0A4U9TAA2_SERFO|nr:hydrogenase 4 subunit D [Serratia fonticola]
MENTLCLQYTALATLLLPFIGALLTACVPQRMAKWICTLFALLATLGTVVIGWLFLAHGKADTTITLLQYGNVALFGFIIDRISTLIVFAVVFLGLLVSLYSTGYLTTANREHPTRAATAITLSC